MENKHITDSRIDYEAKGCIKSGPATEIVMYVFAGLLIIAGIIVYFAVMQEIAVLAVFVFLAALAAFMGISAKKHAWFWDDEKFTICQLFSKPKTYSFNDIENVFTVTEGPAVTLMLRLKNGKQIGISMNENGTREFVEQLGAVMQQRQA